LPCASAITFVGEQADAAALIPALDVLCLTSESEGMPNVLLEAGAWAIRSWRLA
jgi:glycosyltransferase involved in cell wall biosynthesis